MMNKLINLRQLIDRQRTKSIFSSATGCLLLILLSTAAYADQWVPVYEEPKHRLVFENDDAFILNVNIPPGYTSLYHEHKIDLFYVHIVGSRVWAQSLGGERREVDVKAGDLRFSSDNHSMPQIHRVGNLGPTPFHLIGVGIKSKVSSDIEPMEGDTSGMEMVIEKPNARVYRIFLKPGEKTGVHQHNLPFTQIHVTAGKYFSAYDKIISAEPGEFLWQESVKNHQFENAGSEPMEIVELQWR